MRVWSVARGRLKVEGGSGYGRVGRESEWKGRRFKTRGWVNQRRETRMRERWRVRRALSMDERGLTWDAVGWNSVSKK